MTDVLADRPEHFAVDLDLAVAPEQVTTTVPPNRTRHRVLLRLADPLMQVQVADRVRDDGRAEHLRRLPGNELAKIDGRIGECLRVGRGLR